MRERLTGFLLWCVARLNRTKDRRLAWRLHRMADGYDTRPTGQWEQQSQ